jgi:nucleotide-binding universal stress UspA family protein
MFNGHIDFLYARPEPITAAAVYGGALMPGMIEQLQAAAERHHAEMMKAYLSACAREQIPTDIVGPAVGNVTARWHRETGRVKECVAAYGRSCDLLVLGRGPGSDFLTAPTLEGALFDSGRPVLVTGPSHPSFETIAIAWKSTREAARAVNAALPLLMRAIRVVIISVAEREAIDRVGTERLATALRRHGCVVETMLAESDPMNVGEALLMKAYQCGAGLLVMGAYSRTRVRELIFGGVTSCVLEGSELPVLMAH